MSNVTDICERVGRRKLAANLGVGLTAISNAAVAGKFPAAWYPVVRGLCESVGVECPLSVFNWKAPSNEGPLACDPKGAPPETDCQDSGNNQHREQDDAV